MIRFYLLLILFLISLFSFLKAPAYPFWLLAVVVTEYPVVFGGITLLLAVSGIWVQKYQLAGTILGVITLLIFLSPIIRAYWAGNELESLVCRGPLTLKITTTCPSAFFEIICRETKRFLTIFLPLCKIS